MADYQPPHYDMANYLVTENVIPTGMIFVNALPDFQVVSADIDYMACVKVVNGSANPKWLRDTWVLSFQVLGRTIADSQTAEEKCWDVFNKILGSNNITIDNQVYLQFNSSMMPSFMGYLDNSQPLYACHIELVAEGITAIGNREPLC